MPFRRREKQPAPKGRSADRPAEQADASREIARLKQQVAALEKQLTGLLLDLNARKQFFDSK